MPYPLGHVPPVFNIEICSEYYVVVLTKNGQTYSIRLSVLNQKHSQKHRFRIFSWFGAHCTNVLVIIDDTISSQIPDTCRLMEKNHLDHKCSVININLVRNCTLGPGEVSVHNHLFTSTYLEYSISLKVDNCNLFWWVRRNLWNISIFPRIQPRSRIKHWSTYPSKLIDSIGLDFTPLSIWTRVVMDHEIN